jgi:hypothetical protein
MSKEIAHWDLHYSKLNESEVILKEFKSWEDRFTFIKERVLCQNGKKVFILAVEKDIYSNGKKNHYYDSIFIFHLFDDIQFITNTNLSQWRDSFLFEYSSYEEAYEVALDMREPIELCYSNNEPPLEVI